MNRYPNSLHVPAQYEGTQRGNPFSEAMPEMLTYKELMDRLANICYTDFTVTEPDLNEIFMHFYE